MYTFIMDQNNMYDDYEIIADENNLYMKYMYN